MYKILIGIPAMFNNMTSPDGYLRDYIVENDEDMWCDFELDYYPEGNYYKFEFETMLGFDSEDGARKWIEKCLEVLTVYMEEKGYDTSKELNLWGVFTEGVDVTTKFKTIEEAYAWLKMMVYGFHGKGFE